MGFIFNAIRRLIIFVLKLTFYVLAFGAVIVLIPNLPPYTKFTSIQLEPTQPAIGPLAPNALLNNAEPKYKGKLLGPETFQEYKNELYMSLSTGEIVKVTPAGHVTFVTKIGQPCVGLVQEHICGRPLGFQIDEKSNSIYVVDAYHGIWKIDLKTDRKQLLVSPRVDIDKRRPKLFNSIVLGENGDFYWTDSTSDFHLKDGVMGLLADPSGRLFHYNAAKNESKVLLDEMWFPNGLVLSPNKEFLVVSESSRFRLVKYYIAGPNKGKYEVFVAGIPGAPDNLRALPDGSGFLVGLYTVFDEENPLVTRSLASTPIVRKFVARLVRLIELPFEHLNNLYPHYIFEEIVYTIGHFSSGSSLLPAKSGLLQVDWNGNIVASYYNTDKSVFGICDAIVFNDKLHMGYPHKQDFIAVVPTPPLLKSAFAPVKKAELHATKTKNVENKPVQQVPKKIIEEKPKIEKPVQPKVEEKLKVEKPVQPKVEKPVQAKIEKPIQSKIEEKPKVDAKESKVEEKKVEQKVKLQEKPKIDPKPNIEQRQEMPKVEKPGATEPKPNVQNKPVEQPKPTQKPVDRKPIETKPTAPETTPPPKATTAQPVKKNQPHQTETTTTPKPQTKTTPPPKTTDKVTPTPPKTTPMPASQPKTADPNMQKPEQGSPKPTSGKTIPIKEEIKADTVKPQGETLKVIKREGPTEIPVPKM